MASSRSTASLFRETIRSSGLLWAASLALDRLVPYGVLGLWPDRTVPLSALAEQVGTVFRAWGMSEEHIAITVRHVLYSDLHGIDSHGCGMLLHYQRELAEGCLTMKPIVSIVRESDATGLVDGGGGLGHVPGDLAMKLAIAKCREVGVAAVAVRNSGHYGAAGAYASMAAEAGMIGFATTSTRRPSVVPTFGREATLGTNPIAFAAPAGRNPPFLLDMATSAASLGKIATAWRKGASIPKGLAVSEQGKPDTNPRRAFTSRRLLPLGGDRETGGHKGYGLAVAMEMLSTVLAGGGVGHFFMAIDPRKFREPGEFENSLDTLIDALHSSPSLDPATPVLVAGDPEHRAARERRSAGIPLSRSVIEDLRSVARAAGVPFVVSK
jgi:LDH2 family malate/lactate/ureidoglycolate dehydrogenase